MIFISLIFGRPIVRSKTLGGSPNRQNLDNSIVIAFPLFLLAVFPLKYSPQGDGNLSSICCLRSSCCAFRLYIPRKGMEIQPERKQQNEPQKLSAYIFPARGWKFHGECDCERHNHDFPLKYSPQGDGNRVKYSTTPA
jgi:hypothetical protein